MDIAHFQLGGEWLDLKIKSEKGERSLRVKIKPFSDLDKYNIRQHLIDGKVEEFSSRIMDIILDWDLTDGGKPLKCNSENKGKYLPYLVGMNLDDSGDEELEGDLEDEGTERRKVPKNVGLAILNFATDFNNFIKN